MSGSFKLRCVLVNVAAAAAAEALTQTHLRGGRTRQETEGQRSPVSSRKQEVLVRTVVATVPHLGRLQQAEARTAQT